MILTREVFQWWLKQPRPFVTWARGTKHYHRERLTWVDRERLSVSLRCKRNSPAQACLSRDDAETYGLKPCGTCFR